MRTSPSGLLHRFDRELVWPGTAMLGYTRYQFGSQGWGAVQSNTVSLEEASENMQGRSKTVRSWTWRCIKMALVSLNLASPHQWRHPSSSDDSYTLIFVQTLLQLLGACWLFSFRPHPDCCRYFICQVSVTSIDSLAAQNPWTHGRRPWYSLNPMGV